MSLPISTVSSPRLSATVITPSMLTNLTQPQRVAATSDFPVKVENMDTPEARAKASAHLQAAMHAIGTPLRLGQYASDVASALVPTIQSIVLERPDLATAQFGFKSDNRTIKVVSDTLSQRDKAWLQNELNDNSRLVQAVNSFHDQAVDGYTQMAKVEGLSLTQAQTAEVNKKADDMVNFMQLFGRVAAETKKSMANADGTDYAPNGAKIDFSTQPSNAISFLSFMKSADAIASGTLTNVDSRGKTTHSPWREDIFASRDAMPHFFPPSDTKTLGINETV